MSNVLISGRRTAEAAAAYAGTTYRRSIVALRFDDTPRADHDVLLPLLEARRLVAGFAVSQVFLSDFGGLGDPNGGKGLSVAQCLELQARGNELMCHSRRHRDPATDAEFAEEVTSWAQEGRSLGMAFDLFIQPGTYTGAYNFDSYDKFAGRNGEVLADTFAGMEAYVFGRLAPYVRAAPAPQRWGNSSVSMDGSTLAALKVYVDTAVRLGGTVPLQAHMHQIGQPGKLSMTDFKAVLDHVAAHRDAGRLEVLTPSASLFAQPSPSPSSVIADGGLREQATGAVRPPWEPVGSPTVSIGTGQDGGNAVRSSGTSAGVRQWINPKGCRRFRLEAQVRGVSGAPGTARILSRGQHRGQLTSSLDRFFTVPAGDGWTSVVGHFGVDARSSEHQVWLAAGSGDVWWSNVRAYKV